MRIQSLVAGCGVLGALLGAGVAGGVAVAAPAAIATTTTVSASPSTARPFETLMLTATVTTASGVVPTGTVDLTRGGQTLCPKVVVAALTGTASCTVAGPLVVGDTVVTATFTPSSGVAFGTSRATAPLSAVTWTPALRGSATANVSPCTASHLLHVVVSAPAAAMAATVNGLPAPTGTVSAGGVTGTLKGGVADVCVAVFTPTLTYTYSGDANYASAQSSLGIKSPDNTRPAGSGNPADEPTVSPTTAPPTLAATGPGARVAPLTALGLGLVVAGGGIVVASRARRET